MYIISLYIFTGIRAPDPFIAIEVIYGVLTDCSGHLGELCFYCILILLLSSMYKQYAVSSSAPSDGACKQSEFYDLVI